MASQHQVLAQGEPTVIPGQRIGPYKLGVSIQALQARLGVSVTSQPPDPAFETHRWVTAGAVIVTVRKSTGQVVAILVQGRGEVATYRTKEGIGLGAPLDAAWRALVSPDFRRLLTPERGFIVHWYNQMGLAVGGFTREGITDYNTVTYLQVFAAGTADELWPAKYYPRLP